MKEVQIEYYNNIGDDRTYATFVNNNLLQQSEQNFAEDACKLEKKVFGFYNLVRMNQAKHTKLII